MDKQAHIERAEYYLDGASKTASQSASDWGNERIKALARLAEAHIKLAELVD